MIGQRPRFIKPGDETLYPSKNKDGVIETLVNPNIDSALTTDNDSKTSFIYNRYHHLPLDAQRQRLPVFQYRNHILYLLEKYQTLVLIGETGCGKSTQVPQLYLNNNNLSTIKSDFLDSWNDLKAGDFSNNPYACDCNSQWMVDVLTPLLVNTPQNSTIGNMVCKKPADLRGLTFEQLNSASKTLVCTEAENITEVATVSNLAILLGVMIGIIVTFPIVLILVLLWRKGYFARFREKNKHSYGDDDDENEHL